jgi:hypothetical protein
VGAARRNPPHQKEKKNREEGGGGGGRLDGAVPCGGVVAADAGQRRQTPKNSCASLNYYYVASGIVREVVEGGVMCVCV